MEASLKRKKGLITYRLNGESRRIVSHDVIVMREDGCLWTIDKVLTEGCVYNIILSEVKEKIFLVNNINLYDEKDVQIAHADRFNEEHGKLNFINDCVYETD